MHEPAASCPICHTPLPPGARFCPACGNRVEEGQTVRAQVPRHESAASPVEVERVSPRWFGLAPPTLLLLLCVAAAALAAVLLALGSWIPGLLVLGLTLLLLAAFLEAGRRKPDSEVVKTSVAAVDSLRARAGFAADSWRTRSAARREVLRRRSELLRLGSRRDALVRELGETAYRGGDAEPLRGQLRAVDEQIRRLEGEIEEVAARARDQVGERRLQVQQTEVVRPADDD